MRGIREHSPRMLALGFGVLICLCALSHTAQAGSRQVLFVANGYYQQETDIYDHLTALGHDITVEVDYRIKGNTDLSTYDLIIITGFAPNIGYYGLNNIENSGVPVLIVEYWDFWYSYQLGLLNWDSGDYHGDTTVELITDQHEITSGFNQYIEVYDTWYNMYMASINSISNGVTPLIYGWRAVNEAAVISDDARKIVATGIYDTTRFTADGWELFDRMLGFLNPSPSEDDGSSTLTNPVHIWWPDLQPGTTSVVGQITFGIENLKSETVHFQAVAAFFGLGSSNSVEILGETTLAPGEKALFSIDATSLPLRSTTSSGQMSAHLLLSTVNGQELENRVFPPLYFRHTSTAWNQVEIFDEAALFTEHGGRILWGDEQEPGLGVFLGLVKQRQIYVPVIVGATDATAIYNENGEVVGHVSGLAAGE
ncbi:MAG: hypothetical protein GY854_22555 [Deltaproteobacteria bacterium]|nr:hypothetical protein [Deltaproteobacteria bacterium]